MAKQDRLLHGQFGTMLFDTGVIERNQLVNPGGSTVSHVESIGAYLATPSHDDEFVIYRDLITGANPPSNINQSYPGFFATYQYVDLRELLSEKQCLDDIVINVQRMFDTPFPGGTYNMAPDQSIQETFMIVLGNMDLANRQGQPGFDLDTQQLVAAGFAPTDGNSAGFLENGLPFQILYRENRRYFGDPSQTVTSPNQMPTQAVNPPLNPGDYDIDRYTLSLALTDRTVGGYPNLVVGPGITIIRAWQVYPASRATQEGPPTATAANELTFRSSRVVLTIPALQWNISGTQRPLTNSEQAKWYTNILLTQN
jgi:hypothetical protein